MATIVYPPGYIRPDAVYATGVVRPMIRAYDPVAEMQAVTSAFTLSGAAPPGRFATSKHLAPIQPVRPVYEVNQRPLMGVGAAYLRGRRRR